MPLVVLNACQSGTLGQVAAEAAVATRLLEEGAASVVAMAYSVYAVAAAEFMAAFYEALFAGRPCRQAVAAGRRAALPPQERPSPKGPLPLEDWIVPVHYPRRPLSFPAAEAKPRPGRAVAGCRRSTRLRRARPATCADGRAGRGPLAPVGRFVGRDAAFYTLERALRLQRVVVVHGPGGTGKTELAKAFGRWWQETRRPRRPGLGALPLLRAGLASFGLDGVITAIGLSCSGRTSSAALKARSSAGRWCWRRCSSTGCC